MAAAAAMRFAPTAGATWAAVLAAESETERRTPDELRDRAVVADEDDEDDDEDEGAGAAGAAARLMLAAGAPELS